MLSSLADSSVTHICDLKKWEWNAGCESDANKTHGYETPNKVTRTPLPDRSGGTVHGDQKTTVFSTSDNFVLIVTDLDLLRLRLRIERMTFDRHAR